MTKTIYVILQVSKTGDDLARVLMQTFKTYDEAEKEVDLLNSEDVDSLYNYFIDEVEVEVSNA